MVSPIIGEFPKSNVFDPAAPGVDPHLSFEIDPDAITNIAGEIYLHYETKVCVTSLGIRKKITATALKIPETMLNKGPHFYLTYIKDRTGDRIF